MFKMRICIGGVFTNKNRNCFLKANCLHCLRVPESLPCVKGDEPILLQTGTQHDSVARSTNLTIRNYTLRVGGYLLPAGGFCPLDNQTAFQARWYKVGARPSCFMEQYKPPEPSEACERLVPNSSRSYFPYGSADVFGLSRFTQMWHRGVLELMCSSCRYVVRRWHVPVLGVDCSANPRHKQALSCPPPRSRGIPKHLTPYLLGKQAPRHPRWRQEHMHRALASRKYRGWLRRNG